MKAFAVVPGLAESGGVRDLDAPEPRANEALIRTLRVGVDGTDRELMEGRYGEAPPGAGYLVTGHEALGRVVSASSGSLKPGQLVVPIVRRPDPVPCLSCAAGEWDMCLNGRYTERGIKGAHGFLSEYFSELPDYLVPLPESLAEVGVLLEPTSIVEKAIEQIWRIQDRLAWQPGRALVLGAGAIGTLACLLLRLRDLEVHLYSRGDGGRGRSIAEAAGARYHDSEAQPLDHAFADAVGPMDLVIEATGYSPLAFDAIHTLGPNGIVCLTGVSAGSRSLQIDAAHLNLEMVLSNRVMFGTVNANRRHFEQGVRDLEAMETRWPGLLQSLITRRVALTGVSLDVMGGQDLKVVVELGDD